MQSPRRLALFLLAVGLLPYSSAEGCEPGTYSPPRTYSSSPRSGACTDCPANHYCSGGASNVKCPGPHQVSPVNSISARGCTCMPGYYSVDAEVKVAGYYSRECLPCKIDRFCSGGSSDVPCPSFQTSPAKSSSQSACSCRPGYLTSPKGDCRKCLADRYCSGGGAGEIVCPLDTASVEGSISPAACVCNPGLYGWGSAGCSTCPAGSFCILGARNACPAHSSSTVQGTGCTCHTGFRRYSTDVDAACIATGTAQNASASETAQNATTPPTADATGEATGETAVVSLRVVIGIDPANFSQDLRDAFTKGVASALLVKLSAVNITGASRSGGGGVRRRLLAAPSSSTAVDADVTVAATSADGVAARVTPYRITMGLAASMGGVQVERVSAPNVTGGPLSTPAGVGGGASVLVVILAILGTLALCGCACCVFLIWGACQCCQHVVSPGLRTARRFGVGNPVGVHSVAVMVHPPATPYALLR